MWDSTRGIVERGARVEGLDHQVHLIVVLFGGGDGG